MLRFVLRRGGQGIRKLRSRGTVVTDGCELPCGCCELSLGLLDEQSVLLASKPALQSQGMRIHELVYLSS